MRIPRKKKQKRKKIIFQKYYWNISYANFLLKCDCEKGVLLLEEGKTGDYKQSVTESGVIISGVYV